MSFQLGEESEDANGNRAEPTVFGNNDHDLASEIQRRLDAASEMLEELNSEREGLLLQREKVRNTGKEVHDLRVEAADAGVDFWNHLRQWFDEHQNAVPRALKVGYERFQSTHDKLRSTEEDYIQAERNMVGREWTWLDRTNDVYQIDLPSLFTGLLDPKPAAPQMPHTPGVHPPPPTLQNVPLSSHIETPEEEYRAQRARLLGLRSQFDAIRRMEAARFGTPDEIMTTFRPSEDLSASNELLEQMTHCEVGVQHSKEQAMQHTNRTKAMERRNSDPLEYQRLSPPQMTTFEGAQSESALATILQSPKLGEKIGEWLLENLETSYVARAIYRSFMERLGDADPGDDFWLDRRPPYWTADDSELGLEHLGGEALSIKLEHRPAGDHDKNPDLDELSDAQSKNKLTYANRPLSSVEPLKAGSEKILPQDTNILRPASVGSKVPYAHDEHASPPDNPEARLHTSVSASRDTSHAVYGLQDGDVDAAQLQLVEDTSARNSNASQHTRSPPRHDSCFDLLALGTNEALELPKQTHDPEDVILITNEQLQPAMMATHRNISHSNVIPELPGFQPFPQPRELSTLDLSQVNPPDLPSALATMEHEQSGSLSRGREHAPMPFAGSTMPSWPVQAGQYAVSGAAMPRHGFWGVPTGPPAFHVAEAHCLHSRSKSTSVLQRFIEQI